MKPPMNYAKTADGGNVAFTVSGDGYPLVDFHIGPNVNVALEWDIPKQAAVMEAFAGVFRYVRFEARGLANSDPAPDGRKVVDYVLDDIEAVTRTLGLNKFALMTYGAYAEIALRFAASRPAAVTHLVLNNPLTHDQPWTSAEARARKEETLREQAEVRGIDIATRTAETHIGPDADTAAVEALARVLRRNDTPKTAALWEKVWELHHELDLSPFVGLVRAKTVITSNSPFFDPMARELGAAIPGSVLALGEQSTIHTSITQEQRRSIAERLADYICPDWRDVRNRIGGPKHGTPKPESLGALATRGLSPLTAREWEVLSLIAAGRTSAEIGMELVLSTRTVSRHLANIYTKLNIHNRAQAAAYLLRAIPDAPG